MQNDDNFFNRLLQAWWEIYCILLPAYSTFESQLYRDGHRKRKKTPEVKILGDYLLKKVFHPENEKKKPEFR